MPRWRQPGQRNWPELVPFRDYKLKAFADFLEQAEAYARGALAPKTKSAGAKKGKADSAAIEQVCQRTLDLYGKAIDPSVTIEQIEAAVKELESLDAAKSRLDELARQMGYSQKFRSKADAFYKRSAARGSVFEGPQSCPAADRRGGMPYLGQANSCGYLARSASNA
jgi:hypothetical protein